MPSFRRSLVPTFFLLAAPLAAQDTLAVRTHADSVSIRFIDADLRAVVQALGRFMPKPLMVAGLPANRVSLETPAPVARGAVLALLRGLVESQNLSFEEDSAFIRIGPADRPTVRPSAHSADSSQVQLFVLRLKHARAADVAATVNLLFGASGEFSGQGGMSRGTLSDELRRNGSMPVERRNDGTSGEAGTVPSFPRSALSGPVTLVPDELTNALLVRATAADFSLIRAAVEELDLRPLQVLVEVLIVEARRTHDFSVGTTLFVPPQGIPGDADGSIGGRPAGGAGRRGAPGAQSRPRRHRRHAERLRDPGQRADHLPPGPPRLQQHRGQLPGGQPAAVRAGQSSPADRQQQHRPGGAVPRCRHPAPGPPHHQPGRLRLAADPAGDQRGDQ
ncbi:MAG: hypothetical protein IPL76_10220 [Gemmatimonadetes bacterium]|nr:hypothetical protein [Gemmatimonadota bacterium]